MPTGEKPQVGDVVYAYTGYQRDRVFGGPVVDASKWGPSWLIGIRCHEMPTGVLLADQWFTSHADAVKAGVEWHDKCIANAQAAKGFV